MAEAIEARLHRLAAAKGLRVKIKTELIRDRVRRSRSQLELAVVEYTGWYNAAPCTRASVTSRRSNTNKRTPPVNQLRSKPQRCNPTNTVPVEPDPAHLPLAV